MKIEITSYGKKMSVETESDDHTLDEILEIIYGMLVITTYSPSSIIRAFREFAEEKEDNV